MTYSQYHVVPSMPLLIGPTWAPLPLHLEFSMPRETAGISSVSPTYFFVSSLPVGDFLMAHVSPVAAAFSHVLLSCVLYPSLVFCVIFVFMAESSGVLQLYTDIDDLGRTPRYPAAGPSNP